MENFSFSRLTRTLIIAEISANHNQDFDRACDLVRLAAECGADAVKFQAYTPDTLTVDASTPPFQIDHPRWGGQTLYRLYEKAYTPWDWFKKLQALAVERGMLFFATAFDPTSVDVLNTLNVPFHKIASFELVDIPLIEHVAASGKPLMMSTGLADLAEIDEAVRAARTAGAPEIALLRCVSSYPADPDEMNLRTIPHLQDMFQVVVGLSDHTMDIGVAVTAVALGARIVEKHFTDTRSVETPDSFFSMEPDELRALVRNVRLAEQALGTVSYAVGERQARNRGFRRSLFAVRDIRKGEALTAENVRSVRPAGGLSPKHWPMVSGRKAARDISCGTPIDFEVLR